MNLKISSPMRLVLVATAVVSIVVALTPEPVEQPEFSPDQDKSSAHRDSVKDSRHEVDQPWRRRELREPAVPKTASSASTAPPPLPVQAGIASDSSLPPPLPTPISEPVQHDIVYLGRMIQEDKVQIFLSVHGQLLVVSQGDVLNGSWLVQAVSSSDVTLRHVGNGKTRAIAMGNSTVSHAGDVKTVQIGPRFLATGSAPQKSDN